MNAQDVHACVLLALTGVLANPKHIDLELEHVAYAAVNTGLLAFHKAEEARTKSKGSQAQGSAFDVIDYVG